MVLTFWSYHHRLRHAYQNRFCADSRCERKNDSSLTFVNTHSPHGARARTTLRKTEVMSSVEIDEWRSRCKVVMSSIDCVNWFSLKNPSAMTTRINYHRRRRELPLFLLNFYWRLLIRLTTQSDTKLLGHEHDWHTSDFCKNPNAKNDGTRVSAVTIVTFDWLNGDTR